MEKSIHILIVEDERTLARSIERRLIREGFRVDLAFDGDAATEKLFGGEYHFVILDINLPKKSGFDVLKQFREASYETPVLILSARDKVEDRIHGLELGADDYLMKPFDSGELIARVRLKVSPSREGYVQEYVTLRTNLKFMPTLPLRVSYLAVRQK